MRLDVFTESKPWFADGLQFSCTQCGNCCTGGPGHVWLSDVEIDRLAEFLSIEREEVIGRYCRKINGKYSLIERRTPQGMYDCVFLKEVKTRVVRDGQPVTQTRRTCEIYAVRPLQCRTWPFWDTNLEDETRWKRAAKRCPGMNTGRKYAQQQIIALRDATDWPESAPTGK